MHTKATTEVLKPTNDRCNAHIAQRDPIESDDLLSKCISSFASPHSGQPLTFGRCGVRLDGVLETFEFRMRIS